MTITITDSKALQYIHKIRNLAKHNYAIDYLDYLRGYKSEPRARNYNLSEMGAQAVRNMLYESEAKTIA